MRGEKRVYLAVDLGAESGRVMAGLWDGKRIALEEVYRFPNGPVYIAESMRWDVLRLWSEIQNGLKIAGSKYGSSIASVGVDTWGVDFVLLDEHQELLGLPYHYRDCRTRGALKRAFRKVPKQTIFQYTGIQFMEINSLYQLIEWYNHAPTLVKAARYLLFMPDYFHWCLSGALVVEYTIASTSQFLNPLKRTWAIELLRKFRIPQHFLPDIVPPGKVLGRLRKGVVEYTGLPKAVRVIAPASHDTASAVVGVPTANTGRLNWAYISSGTWSLMGVEIERPVINEQSLKLNFTNEGGVNYTTRLLKNIMGLWLVQGCRRSFQSQGKEYSYADLVNLAKEAQPLKCIIDPDDPSFLNPKDMPTAIRDFCRRSGQPEPQTEGDLVRCALESLAIKYRVVLSSLEQLTGSNVEVIHIVGGGSQNELLNQMTADACGRTVLAGPVEATALGNVMVQAMADREVKNLSEIREVIRNSVDLRKYDPNPQTATQWEDALDRFQTLLRKR